MSELFWHENMETNLEMRQCQIPGLDFGACRCSLPMASGKWIIVWEIITKSFGWYGNCEIHEKCNAKELASDK